MSESVQGLIKYRTNAGLERVVKIDTISTAVAFERKFDVPATVLSMSPRMEWLAFMAWHAAGASGEFDEFVDSLDAIESVDEGEGEGESANPTAGDQ